MPKFKFTVTQYGNAPETGQIEAFSLGEARQKIERMHPEAEPSDILIEEKGDALKKVGDGAAAVGSVAGAGAIGIVGCLIQCVLSAIPVLIGLWIIGWFLRSCSG